MLFKGHARAHHRHRGIRRGVQRGRAELDNIQGTYQSALSLIIAAHATDTMEGAAAMASAVPIRPPSPAPLEDAPPLPTALSQLVELQEQLLQRAEVAEARLLQELDQKIDQQQLSTEVRDLLQRWHNPIHCSFNVRGGPCARRLTKLVSHPTPALREGVLRSCCPPMACSPWCECLSRLQPA